MKITSLSTLPEQAVSHNPAIDSSDQWTVISSEKVYSYAFQTEICTSFSCKLL